MYLYILKLKEILNDPTSINLNNDFCQLNESLNPPLLIYGKILGEAILKSKNFLPLNLIEYFKAINNISKKNFPSIERYFKESPLFMSDQIHFDIRNELSIVYRNIESKLPTWLNKSTKNFFKEIKKKQISNPILIAEIFTLNIFKEIIMVELDCDKNSSIEFPGGILNTYKSHKSLDDYEHKLNILFKFIERKLFEKKRPIEDAWKIISIAVMGTEPILNALALSMVLNSDHKKKWSANTLLHELSPISFTARICTKQTKIKNHIIKEGQEVYVSLSLINQFTQVPSSMTKKNSFAFGLGKHTCPGRKIALMITQAFIDEWEKSKQIKIDSFGMITSRDLVLRLKKN